MTPRKDCTASTAARYGCPSIVVADNGRHFTGKDFTDSAEKLGFRIQSTTPRHPQSNGLAERRFRELAKALKIYTKTLYTWENVLPELTLAIHNTINRISGYSPAQLVFSQPLRLPFDFEHPTLSSSFFDIDTEMAYQLDRENFIWKQSIKSREEKVERPRFAETNFAVGDFAFLFDEQVKVAFPTRC